MLLRVVVIFLLFMIAMAMLQRFLGRNRKGKGGNPTIAKLGLACPGCGRLRISPAASCTRPGCDGQRKG